MKNDKSILIDEILKLAKIPDLSGDVASISGRLQRDMPKFNKLFSNGIKLKGWQIEDKQKNITEFHEQFKNSVTDNGRLTPKGKAIEYLDTSESFFKNLDLKGYMFFLSNIIVAGSGHAVVTKNIEELNKTSEKIIEEIIKEKN